MRTKTPKRLVFASKLALALVASFGAISASGCGGADSLVLDGGHPVDVAKVDTDPVSVLPAGILMFGYVDAAALFQSSLGPEVSMMVQSLLPLPPEAGFVPGRDVTRIFSGVYAMQGADFCAVIQGSFNMDAIHRSVETRAVSLAGVPLVKTRYADADLYTAGNIGFTILTAQTALAGNEIGMRRALDRIRYGKLERSVPEWMTNLGRTPGAAFSLAGDFSTQSPSSAATQSLPFLQGATAVRLIGNYKSPGMNIVGTLSFSDPESAQSSESAIQTLSSIAPFMSFLSALGLGVTIPPIKSARNEKDLGIAVAMDESTSRTLLRKGGDVLRNVVHIGEQQR